jgi:hypothetical protein
MQHMRREVNVVNPTQRNTGDTTMATGERSFTTAGRKVSKFESTPITPGEYELKPNFSKWEIKVSEEGSKLPYLNGPMTVLGSAEKEGQKDRQVYCRFFLNTELGNDGVAGTDRGDGIVAFCSSAGVELKVGLVRKMRGEKLDKEGNVVKPAAAVDVLNPQQALAWLKSQDGVVVRARIKNRKWNDRVFSDVDYFIESDESSSSAPEETEEVMEESPEEDAPEEIEEPAPKAKAKPALKVAAGSKRR